MNDVPELEYVGFWPRVGASIVDTILVVIATAPLAHFFYDDRHIAVGFGTRGQMPSDFWTSLVLPAIIVIAFWSFKQATPGKMLVHAKIVDAQTGGVPTMKQNIIRYLGYFLSTFPVCLGFLWVAFDNKKQGWHDKLAGTVVVREVQRKVESVQFER